MRGLHLNVRMWGDPTRDGTEAQRPAPLLMLHGWMDVGASFQFLVDALAELGPQRDIVAPDWRGFGLSDCGGGDTYWFPDHLADLDALVAALWPAGTPVDVLGHSMGGNIAMGWAAARPERVRRLVNLEGFGVPDTPPEEAPQRLRRWLDGLQQPARLRDYASCAEVAARLRANNPRLSAERAAWLAPHWAAAGRDGRWTLRSDPVHKRSHPVLSRRDESIAHWRAVTAPVLFVEGDATDTSAWWGTRYPREDFEQRLAVVPRLQRARLADCGHMLHHDQPQALARLVQEFLDG